MIASRMRLKDKHRMSRLVVSMNGSSAIDDEEEEEEEEEEEFVFVVRQRIAARRPGTKIRFVTQMWVASASINCCLFVSTSLSRGGDRSGDMGAATILLLDVFGGADDDDDEDNGKIASQNCKKVVSAGVASRSFKR